LTSDWYQERLKTQQKLDIARWTRHRHAVKAFMSSATPLSGVDLLYRLTVAEQHLLEAESGAYVASLVGTIGADPCVLP
jgi:hypothetical protein